MSKRQKMIVWGILITLILFLSACSGDNGTGAEGTEPQTESVSVKPEIITTTETTIKKETEAPETTKEKITTEETTTEVTSAEVEKKEPFSDDLFVMPESGQRPIAVLIDNEGSGVLPQGGPGLAQVVYEILVEGGITRIMPVYWGQDIELLGPVRSARHYILDYMKEIDAFFVHYGWSPQAKYDIADNGIEIANGVSNAYSIFWDITKDKGNWQDTYTSSKNIENFMDHNRYSKQTKVNIRSKFNNKWIIPEGGTQCHKLNIGYSSAYRVGYEYNPETGLYERTRQGKAHMERNNGKQIEAGNIVIMMVKNHTIKGDDAGRQELETVGTGKGYYITSGKIMEINWSKESRFAMSKFTDADGTIIKFNPARTWIQVVPVEAVIDYE